MPETPLLDTINLPKDLRQLEANQLPQIAAELRSEMISAVSFTGGHLGAGLGVVELTTALHYVFNTPDDKLIWDVGHQCYPHKILTGRRDRIRTLRKGGGLSGFTKRSESQFDPFGAGHSSTSISAGLGMATARDLKGKKNNVISVIGDGAISGGMAYEALNHAGYLRSRMIIILNDNDMSIAPPVGALSATLAKLSSSKSYRSMRSIAKDLAEKFPQKLEKSIQRAERMTRQFFGGTNIFEDLGMYYIGPIDGHNLEHLLPILSNLRDDATLPDGKPVFIHCITKKGHGYSPAENSTDKMHGVSSFNVITGEQKKSTPNAPSYTSIFGKSLIEEAEKDDKIVAITAAMPDGTGLNDFNKKFPTRCFDVGIAEQHGISFAAGLAAEGMKPFAAIYSTFLQRAYDQIIHDVAIQKLPVRFAIDRAGFVGADGSTHSGSFDTAYLGCVPNMVLMAAGDEAELKHMVTTAAAYDETPIAFRYPRGEGMGVTLPEQGKFLEIGKGRILKEGTKIAILSYGGRLQESLEAAKNLDAHGLSTTVADARFAKPLDTELLHELIKNHEILITIEEGASGGFNAIVLQELAMSGLLDKGIKIRPMTMQDRFIEQNTAEAQYKASLLDAASIVKTAFEAIGISEKSPLVAHNDSGK